MAYVPSPYHGGMNQPEQVTDAFLTCRLCNVPGFQYAKQLGCGHTFCRDCLQAYAGASAAFPCPLCGALTRVPDAGVAGLRDNLFVENQVDRLLRRHNKALGRDDSLYCITKYY